MEKPEKKTELPEFDEYYALWLLISQTRAAVFKARHKKVGKYVHFNQAAALITTWALDGQATPFTISRHLFLEPHSVSELISRLEKKGLVLKRKDTEKENVVRVSITEKGKEFCRATAREDFIRDIMSSLTARQRKQLYTSLMILFREALKTLDMDDDPPLLIKM